MRRLRPILERPDARVLDLCCGPGDLSIALRKNARASVFGSDFCLPMLTIASSKNAMPFFEADALDLPVSDRSLDAITVAFGFRNLANYERGLIELRRALRPGGTVAILEFSQPPNAIATRSRRWIERLVRRFMVETGHIHTPRSTPLAADATAGSRD